MNDSTATIEDLKKRVHSFIDERDWRQFHTPKNVSMALAVEAAELMEFFMWHTGEESVQTLEKKREVIEQEVADIASYLLSLCVHYNIDLASAMERKELLNARKYPVEKSKGISTKYSDL